MSASHRPPTAEHARLETVTSPEGDLRAASDWYEWGPYLAERAWGSVREDYSADGDAWASFPFDHVWSRAYRWNEDGLAGISDIDQRLCLALALWNGRDPILKERIFGLGGPEGNHGEDAKEYWWYLDALPSHVWLRWRYHYPQQAFPYDLLRAENGRRGFHDPEFELLDTGAFDENRYWAVDVTYAKASPFDVLMRITVTNHGPEPDELHVLPTLWCRNTWSSSREPDVRPSIVRDGQALRAVVDETFAYDLLAADGPAGSPAAVFCDNDTNDVRVFGAATGPAFPKDGINDHVVEGIDTVNPAGSGTKAAWWYRVTVAAGATVELRLRLRRRTERGSSPAPGASLAGAEWNDVIARREQEADEFYAALLPDGSSPDVAKVVREASAGLVWSKQYYPFRVARWLDGDPGRPEPPAERRSGRNSGWRHLDADDILAMPDPWEYPWFAAWDLAFHAISWTHLDPAFAKYQVLVLLREWFLKPNGALPAYEWNFDDVNPPVHAFAALRVFLAEAGSEDRAFLERVFQKLLLNYMWWLNQEDPEGNDLFGGGFLGLDNISPIDRSHLPDGAHLVQADGTAWMAFYTLSMLSIALLLAEEDEVYDDLVVTFLERFMMITRAIDRAGLYDAERGFFYDFVETPEGRRRVEVETIGGAVPLFPAVSIRGQDLDERRYDVLRARILRILDREEATVDQFESVGRLRRTGRGEELLVSVVAPTQLRASLAELLDEESFLSPHGLRSLSKRYDGRPYVVTVDGVSYPVDYEPAESTTPMYGGNSNWRGPVWIPMNYLVIRSLARFHEFVGDDFTVEYPTGSGTERSLLEVAQDLADRLVSIFVRDKDGHRPVFGGTERLQRDPEWDHLLFHEYFHGDNGAGLGASHQTGWTALVIDLILDPPMGGRTARRFEHATTRPVEP